MMTDRTYADEVLDLIRVEPEHLVVLPARRRWWGAKVWLICHASVAVDGEYDLRPIAEVVGPVQRLRFGQYRNPLLYDHEERRVR
jgi:hypothetical protein